MATLSVRKVAEDAELREFEVSEGDRPYLRVTVARDDDNIDGKYPWATTIERVGSNAVITGCGEDPRHAFEDAYLEWDARRSTVPAYVVVPWKDVESALLNAGAFRLN